MLFDLISTFASCHTHTHILSGQWKGLYCMEHYHCTKSLWKNPNSMFFFKPSSVAQERCHVIAIFCVKLGLDASHHGHLPIRTCAELSSGQAQVRSMWRLQIQSSTSTEMLLWLSHRMVLRPWLSDGPLEIASRVLPQTSACMVLVYISAERSWSVIPCSLWWRLMSEWCHVARPFRLLSRESRSCIVTLSHSLCFFWLLLCVWNWDSWSHLLKIMLRVNFSQSFHKRSPRETMPNTPGDESNLWADAKIKQCAFCEICATTWQLPSYPVIQLRGSYGTLECLPVA